MATGGFGGALFLIAVGAILRYAITWESDAVDIDVVGAILMVVGIVMIVLTLLFLIFDRRPPSTPPPR